MHKGTVGTENLNRELRDILNPDGRPIRGDRFRVGYWVMQTRNNYDKEVFNGDVGRIASFNSELDEAVVEFEGRAVQYHVSEMDEMILAYAVTIHKAQGSEYVAVIVPLSTQHYVLLRRNLLYTAMTRGKELVVLLGSRKALQMAVENRIVEPDYTDLARKIKRRPATLALNGSDNSFGRRWLSYRVSHTPWPSASRKKSRFIPRIINLFQTSGSFVYRPKAFKSVSPRAEGSASLNLKTQS